MRTIHVSKVLFGLMVATALVRASTIGEIFVCYACQNTGNTAIDAALANNPDVASDGILFAFVNTSGFAISGGVFSENGSPNDSFMLPAIAAGATFILIPGVTTGGGSHPSGGLFGATGVMDTSDGGGGVLDTTEFKFTGLSNSLAVSSITFGTSTPVAGEFTPGDPGLIMPWRSPSGGSTSFIGDGPSGDGGCTNCYFGEVATLQTPNSTSTPEPAAFALIGVGLAAVALLKPRREWRAR
jgi:hypothetical protein